MISFDSFRRAPVPEYEEVARAFSRRGLSSGVRLAQWLALPAFAVSSLFGVLLAVGAWVWPGGGTLLAAALLLGVAVWVDAEGTRCDCGVHRLFDTLGLRAPVRALIRDLWLLAVIAAEPDRAGLAAVWVVVVAVTQALWHARIATAVWLQRTAGPLRYRQREEGTFHWSSGGSVADRHAAHYRAAVGSWQVEAWFAPTATLVAALALPGVPPWWWTLFALVPLAVGGVRAREAVRLAGASRRHEQELYDELSALGPRYLVYVSLSAGQAKYIVNQWLPALETATPTGFLLVREASQLSAIGPTALPIVYAPAPRHVERLTLPTVRAALYPAYGERNGQLLRNPAIKHVMILHGDSDKATSANAMARAFDEVWVAGPAGVERYRDAGVDLPPERFVIVGRPQTAGLAVGPRQGDGPPVVLYAPTFEGFYDQTTHTSLETMGPGIVAGIQAKLPEAQVWFKPHPASGVSRPGMLRAKAEIAAMLRPTDVFVDDHPDLTLPDCLQAADVLISDVSSVVTDFLYTERPVIACDPAGLGEDAFWEHYPTLRCAYVLDPSLAKLDDCLAEALGPDPLRQRRLEIKRHVLGDLPEGPLAAFNQALENVTGLPQGLPQ